MPHLEQQLENAREVLANEEEALEKDLQELDGIGVSSLISLRDEAALESAERAAFDAQIISANKRIGELNTSIAKHRYDIQESHQLINEISSDIRQDFLTRTGLPEDEPDENDDDNFDPNVDEEENEDGDDDDDDDDEEEDGRN